MSRSLNKVELIGNLTRDPELRYTPAGAAVCTFGLATNRQWTTDSGDKKEDVEFHRIVSWNKLAELCSQLLTKGRKVYVEGRLQTRKWTGQDQVERTTTEIVISDMIILDSRSANVVRDNDFDIPEELDEMTPAAADTSDLAGSAGKDSKTSAKNTQSKTETKADKKAPSKKEADLPAEEDDDIPF